MDNAKLCQSIKQCICAIVTVVGVDQEVRDPNVLVVRDPFQQERRFVAHCRDRKNAHLILPACVVHGLGQAQCGVKRRMLGGRSTFYRMKYYIILIMR